MTNDSENSGKGFKVEDRRRFDPAGNERSGEGRGGALGEAADSSARANPADSGDISFVSFVVSLGTQAHMLLGDAPAPPGVNIPVDIDAAKQTIDILAMLKQKTKGNLDQSEDRLLEDILHTLRMSYLKKSSK